MICSTNRVYQNRYVYSINLYTKLDIVNTTLMKIQNTYQIRNNRTAAMIVLDAIHALDSVIKERTVERCEVGIITARQDLSTLTLGDLTN